MYCKSADFLCNLQQFRIQNASEEWKSADFLRNLQQFEIQNALQEWKFCRGIPAPGCIFRPAKSKSMKNPPNGNNSFSANFNFSKNLNMKSP
jgi:hypothetical protein